MGTLKAPPGFSVTDLSYGHCQYPANSVVIPSSSHQGEKPHQPSWQPKCPERASSVTQSCPTLCDPVDCSLTGSSVHGISQARILDWTAISFSRGSSRHRNQTHISRIASGFLPLSHQGSPEKSDRVKCQQTVLSLARPTLCISQRLGPGSVCLPSLPSSTHGLLSSCSPLMSP